MKKLKNGWVEGTAAEFLGMSEKELDDAIAARRSTGFQPVKAKKAKKVATDKMPVVRKARRGRSSGRKES